MVTDRIRPVTVQGRRIHQVGVPYHWGWKGLTRGGAGNDLAAIVLDPNVHIQEVKALTCEVLPGRRPRGPALLELVDSLRARALARNGDVEMQEPAGERST